MVNPSQETFPPDGRVVVIGMATRQLQLRFGERVCWMNHWELFGKFRLPEKVAAICVSVKLQQEHLTRIRSLAEKLEIKRFELEASTDTLEERLKFWFGGNGHDSRVGGDGVGILAPPRELQTEGEIKVVTSRVRPLKGQPRTHFSRGRMNELMTSIKAIGQQTPILVRRVEGNSSYDYELLDGERRLRACTLLGITEMLAVVRTVANDEEQFTRSFVANFAREGHTPLDTARAISKMLAFPELKQLGRTASIKRIANIAGKSEVWVYQYLKLLTLPTEVQAMLEPDENDRYVLPLSMGTYLCTIEHREIQLKICQEVIKNKLSMNQARNLARKLAIEAGLKAGSAQRRPDDDYRIMCNYLRKTVEGSENLLTMPHRSLDELFLHRGLDERNARIHEIDQAITLLTKLRRALEIKRPKERK